MAFITDILNTIKNARKGKDMRQAIYDGIRQCYNDATGHPESVAAAVKKIGEVSANLSKETADRKAEVNTERKRIDNLIKELPATAGEYQQSKLVLHSYDNAAVKCTTTSGNYTNVPAFTTDQGGPLSSLYTKKSNYQIAVNKSGLYLFELKIHVNSLIANKRVELAPFVNDTRIAALASSYNTAGNFTLTQVAALPLWLSANDTVDFRIAPIEAVEVRLQLGDVLVYAIDWEDKFKIPDYTGYAAETKDIRTGADGTVYGTAGEAVRKQIGNITEDKVDKPSVADNNKIPRAKNGGVEWVEVGQPTDEQTNNAVTSWLNNHPEATTTVQNKSITSEKLSTDLYYKTFPFSVTPQMFGAKGDESDDTDAFIKMFDYVNVKKCKMLIPEGTYVITKDLPKLYKGFCLIGSNAGTSRNETTILDKRQSSKYLIDIDKELDGFLGGSIENIAFSTEGEYENFGIHCSSSWDAHIDNCAFWGYETALKLDGDEAKISNCQFIFCGSKTEKTTYNYGVVLENANEKRFDKCHFENSRFFVYILGSSWSNSFNNCKFETATLNSAINTSVPTIFLDSITSNYCTNFVNCDFHALDLEYYVSKAGISSYSDVPFMVKAGTNNELNITTCTFVCGPGSGAEMYNQFSQARFIEATFANIANCAFIKPSYIVPCVNVNHLNMNGCCIVLDKNGDYSIGEYSENSPIINTEFGKLANISFCLLKSDVDKYYRICNKNFDFVTPRNGLFCRGNELYSNTIFIIIKAHNSNFAIPYEILISNGESGNLFGCIKGTFVSWSESIGNSNRYYNLQGTGTVTVYFIDDTLAIKLAGFNESFGAFVNFKTIEILPIDWYICIDYDVSKATKAIEITDPN